MVLQKVLKMTKLEDLQKFHRLGDLLGKSLSIINMLD